MFILQPNKKNVINTPFIREYCKFLYFSIPDIVHKSLIRLKLPP